MWEQVVKKLGRRPFSHKGFHLQWIYQRPWKLGIAIKSYVKSKSTLNALKYSHTARRKFLQKQRANFGQERISFHSTTQSTPSPWVNLPLWLCFLTRLVVFQSQCGPAQTRAVLCQDQSLLCQSANDTGLERLCLILLKAIHWNFH